MWRNYRGGRIKKNFILIDLYAILISIHGIRYRQLNRQNDVLPGGRNNNSYTIPFNLYFIFFLVIVLMCDAISNARCAKFFHSSGILSNDSPGGIRIGSLIFFPVHKSNCDPCKGQVTRFLSILPIESNALL
jgi:hypothetical protein